jgi:type I restriction enzyme S subunit
MGTSAIRKVKLKEICHRITVGHVGPMADRYTAEGIPFLRSQNIAPFRLNVEDVKYVPREFHEKLRKSALRPGDVAVVRTGYPGTACVIPDTYEELNCADLVVITPSGELNPYYLAAIFNSAWGMASVAGNLVGVAQQHFNVGAAKELEVRLPPRTTQDRIAGILSAYDELIENSQRRIKILEAMARALYREWFVHFRLPGQDSVPRVPSLLGEIPDGWEVKKLKDVCRLTMGQSPASEFYNETGEGQPFHQGVTDFGDRFPTDRLFCTIEGRIAERGDILFSVRAPVGRMNIADKKITIGRGLSAIRHNDDQQAFLWEQLRSRFTKDDMIGNGAIFAAVTKNDMQGIEILCPPRSLVESAEKHFAPLHDEVGNLTRKIQNLGRTRDLLLPRLLSGQIDVEAIAS